VSASWRSSVCLPQEWADLVMLRYRVCFGVLHLRFAAQLHVFVHFAEYFQLQVAR
jgi:hypothetical protein